jgi:hypothetical protein
VAARPQLHAIFDRDRRHDAVFDDTWNVDNGSRPHQLNFYHRVIRRNSDHRRWYMTAPRWAFWGCFPA